MERLCGRQIAVQCAKALLLPMPVSLAALPTLRTMAQRPASQVRDADRVNEPALQPEQLVILGPRDDEWRRQFNVGTLADSRVFWIPKNFPKKFDVLRVSQTSTSLLWFLYG